MGNIDIDKIWKKGFEEGSWEEAVETYCRRTASMHTDALLKKYITLPESRNGKYINSDLMKMVYPFYALSKNNRRKFNMSITNTAAVLTNEAFTRALQSEDVKRCIFVVGPYGAGKSFFVQSLFENAEPELLDGSIVYEGSITPPAFEEKIKLAIENGVTPDIFALYPTLELSMRNIRERAKRIGRDVEKNEVVSKFHDFCKYLLAIIEEYPGMAYTIYNKESNIPSIDLKSGSKDLANFNFSTMEEVSEQYDVIAAKLDEEEKVNNMVK